MERRSWCYALLQADREEKARLKILTLNMSTRMEQQENEQGTFRDHKCLAFER